MRQHTQAALRETGPVLNEASTHFSQKHEVEAKQELLAAFKKHFVLSDEELEILTSMVVPVDDRFFKLLARLKRIHRDCQVLLGSESEQLGLELMEKSSKNLDNAFQKLFRWIQREFKSLNLENPQINASIRRSLRVLAERPTLFSSCLEFFAESRERNLSESFYAAMTGSSRGQNEDANTKPIEYYSHDSLRFVGDMLAWTHSATVSEREALEVLFISEGEEMAKGIQVGIESEPWLQAAPEVFNGEKALEQLVNRDLTGVGRALRHRVEQVIQSDEDPVLAYKIANLIDFYRVTFRRLLGSDSSLLETLSNLRESAMGHYRAAMQDHVNAIQTETESTPTDMAIPSFLDEALSRLKELMKTYDSSLAPATSRESEFQPILAEALDPFLDNCEHVTNRLEEPARSIFTINCLTAVRTTLIEHDFTGERVSEIDDTIEEYATKLVDYQHAYFTHTSRLSPMISALSSLTDSDEDIRSIPTLDPFKPAALMDASQMLDDFLPSALTDATENLRQLKNPRLAEDITAEAANRFCEDFEFLESRLATVDELLEDEGGEDGVEADEEPEGGEGLKSLRALFPRTSGEIRVLLS